MNEVIYESILVRVYNTEDIENIVDNVTLFKGQSYYAIIKYDTINMKVSLLYRYTNRLPFNALETLKSVFGSEYEYIGGIDGAMTSNNIKVTKNDLTKLIKVVENTIVRAVI